MKIKLKDVLEGLTAFRELQEVKFPPRTALNIYKLSKVLDTEFESYREVSKKMYENHSVPMKETGEYDLESLSPEVIDTLNTEAEELLTAEVEVNAPEITVSELERSGVTVSPNMVRGLHWLIKDD